MSVRIEYAVSTPPGLDMPPTGYTLAGSSDPFYPTHMPVGMAERCALLGIKLMFKTMRMRAASAPKKAYYRYEWRFVLPISRSGAIATLAYIDPKASARQWRNKYLKALSEWKQYQLHPPEWLKP